MLLHDHIYQYVKGEINGFAKASKHCLLVEARCLPLPKSFCKFFGSIGPEPPKAYKKLLVQIIVFGWVDRDNNEVIGFIWQ